MLSSVTASGDWASGVHNQPISVAAPGVLANDYANGTYDYETMTYTPPGPMSAVLDNGPANGSVSLSSDGSYTYTPNHNFFGYDSFTYHATADSASSEVVTVWLNVTNSTPWTNDRYLWMTHNQVLDVSANGLVPSPTDWEGDPISAILVENVQHGTLDLYADGTFTYTPNHDFVGYDTFTYNLTDGLSTSPYPGRVSFNVTNYSPWASDRNYSLGHNQSLDISTNGLVSSPFDGEGDPITALLVDNVQHGTLDFHADGTFTYTPNHNFVGYDSFTYNLTDGLTTTFYPGRVSFNVTNYGPSASDRSFSLTHDQSLNVTTNGLVPSPTDGEGDPVTALLVDNVQHGTLDFHDDGTFIYTPNHNFVGYDTFTYNLTDGISTTFYPGRVSFNVTNSGPYASGGSYSANNTQPLVVNSPGLIPNPVDYDGDTITASLVMTVSHGSLVLNSNGTFTYTAASNYAGSDSFTYTLSDGIATSNVATISIWVVHGPPIAVPPGPQINVEHDTVSVAVSVLNPGGNQLSYSASGLPSGLSINSTTGVISGTVDYGTAAAGPYTVQATVSSPYGSDTKSFTWTVNALPPVVTSPGSQTSNENDTVNVAVTATDPASYVLTYSATGLPSGLSIDATTGMITGTIAYKAEVSGPYLVTVTATNSQNKAASETFTWIVNALPPVVTSPGNQTSKEDDIINFAVTATDPASYVLTYSATGLPNGLSINPTTGVITGSIASGTAALGPYNVTLTVTNEALMTASATFDWVVRPLPIVSVVASDANASEIGPNGGSFTISLAAASNSDITVGFNVFGTALSQHDYSGLPNSVTFLAGQTSITISFTPVQDADNTEGDETVTVILASSTEYKVNEDNGGAVVTVSDDSTPVSISMVGDKINTEDDAVSLALSATGPSGSIWTYSASPLPTGLSFDAMTGLISGSIPFGSAKHQPYRVEITATNQCGISDSKIFDWAITAKPPVVAQPGDQVSSDGDSPSLAVGWSDPGGHEVSFTATGLPAGITMNSSTGEISGTVIPGASGGGVNGIHEVTVFADNTFACSSTTFIWTVHPKLTFTSLAVNPDYLLLSGGTVSLTGFCNDSNPLATMALTVSWGDGQQSNFTILPGQSSFEVSHSYGAVPNAGTYTISATVSDSGVIASNSTKIQFEELAVTSLSATPNPITTIGGQVTVSGSLIDSSPLSSPSLTISWGDGSSTNYSLNPGQTTFGSLTHDYEERAASGTYTINATLTDGAFSASRSTVLVVNQAPPLAITSATLSPTPIFTTGGTATLTGTYTDPYPSGTAALMISWGDGSVTAATISNNTFTASHTYGMMNNAVSYPIGIVLSDHNKSSSYLTSLQMIGPSISGISAVSIDEDTIGSVTFELLQSATVPTANVSVTSSDGALLAVSNQVSGTVGTIQLMPQPNKHGNASVVVTVTDIAGATYSTSFAVEIRSVNDAPVGRVFSLKVPDGQATLSGSLNDGSIDVDMPDDTLTFAITSQPSVGSVTISANGGFTYTAPGDWLDPSTSFSWQVTDSEGSTAGGTVSVDLKNDLYAAKRDALIVEIMSRIQTWHSNSEDQLQNNLNAANSAIAKLQGFDSSAGTYFANGVALGTGITLAIYSNPVAGILGTLAEVGASFAEGTGSLSSNLSLWTSKVTEIYNSDENKLDATMDSLIDEFSVFLAGNPTNRELSNYIVTANIPEPPNVAAASESEINHIYGALLLQYAGLRGWVISGSNYTLSQFGYYWHAEGYAQVPVLIDATDVADELNAINFR